MPTQLRNHLPGDPSTFFLLWEKCEKPAQTPHNEKMRKTLLNPVLGENLEDDASPPPTTGMSMVCSTKKQTLSALPLTVPPAAVRERFASGCPWARRERARQQAQARRRNGAVPPSAAQDHRESVPWERSRQDASSCGRDSAKACGRLPPSSSSNDSSKSSGWRARALPDLGRVVRLVLPLLAPGLLLSPRDGWPFVPQELASLPPSNG